ncbi:MAG: hydroxymethylbilane synthase [Verrucomicrobia bacterium]|nr:hydroxymethylbilane synthase [Verrucomicrobiota bacterium]
MSSKRRSMPLSVKVGARSSPLSRAQVEEVYSALRAHHPDVLFEMVWVSTHGDQDRTTSLRDLDKTDFFTREIDALQLSKGCQISIHSAKDLPDPLAHGLEIAALTKGVDPSDSLVVRLEELPRSPRIGTSSKRREANIRSLYPTCAVVDIRGTIQERLALLEKGLLDGVVIAEAALIRLGLTHLKRLRLPGPVAPLQGKLAILCRLGDEEMKQLFACIHHEEDLVSGNRPYPF